MEKKNDEKKAVNKQVQVGERIDCFLSIWILFESFTDEKID